MPDRAPAQARRKPQKCGRREHFKGPRVESQKGKEEKRHFFKIIGKFCGKLMGKMRKARWQVRENVEA